MFLAEWREALFMHFRADPRKLQPLVPLPLDLRDGDAYVSLVAFTQHRLRPAIGGPVAEFIGLPLAHHEFLNLRTYVVNEGEPGIYFVSEWIPNRLAVLLGPRLYGLPYHLGEFAYHTVPGRATRHVVAGGCFSCAAIWNSDDAPVPSQRGSEAEFLLERYTAYTMRGRILRRFRIAHAPWRTAEAKITIIRRDLLANCPVADPCAAHFSPGLRDVQISSPAVISRGRQ
jgi:uncharacterized protein YqjF (DUF2071 family)